MSERTPEEREAARREREARRDGRSAPPAQPPEPPQPPPGRREAAVAPPQPPPPPPPRSAPRRPRSPSERRAAATEFLGGRRGGARVPRRAAGEPGGRHRRTGLYAAIAGGVLSLVAAWFLLSLFQPLEGGGSGEVIVEVPEGATVSEIADLLERRDVISSAFFFRLRASLAGAADEFKAGEVAMAHDMSYGDAIDALANPLPPDVVTVTIPEGLSRGEAEELVGDALRGDYSESTRRSRVLDPGRYGGARADSLEGFLFPATYELEPGAHVRDLVALQLHAFKQRLAQIDMGYARSKRLNVYDVVTIASMIDREAQVARERRLVASVIYNRLRQGIPLGIDATIRFATGNWSEPLKVSELEIDSGYNTRLYAGLPPGPIGNPGLAALRAAAHPAETGYLFYVVKPGTCGEHSFSETDAEFQQDVDAYNDAREAAGGQSPTTC